MRALVALHVARSATGAVAGKAIGADAVHRIDADAADAGASRCRRSVGAADKTHEAEAGCKDGRAK